MCLIVFGHTIVYSEHCSLIYQFLYSFHVAMFFVISGYTFKVPYDYLKFIRNKFIRIMIPYFIWSFLFLIPYLILGQSLNLKSADKSSFDIMTQCKNILYGNGNNFALKQNSSLWFLPALFTMEVVYGKLIKMFDKVCRIKGQVFVCCVLLFVGFLTTILLENTYFPWGINTTIQFGVFFYIGYLARKYDIFEKKLYFSNLFITEVVLILSGSIACFLNYKKVSAIDYSYGNYWLAFISGVSISFVLVMFCRRKNKCFLLEYLGRNTMGILIFHKIILIICQSKLGIITNLMKNSYCLIELFISITIVCVAIIFSLIINYIIKKHLPFLVGEKIYTN